MESRAVFKWIKQHLKIKSFWGESENAVRSQVWIAICTYLTIAIAKKELKLERSLYEILQILSVSAFDKTPVNQLLINVDLNYCTVKKVNIKKEYEGCLHQVDEKKCKTNRHTLVDKGIKYNANI